MDVQRLVGLIDRYAGPLELFARQWCENPEDVVQEAFVKLATAVLPPDRAASWLFQVVRRGAINAGKAADRRRRHESKAFVHRTAWFEPDPTAIEPGDAVEALQSLPVGQREVIVARLWGGLSFEEIARLVGGSPSGAHRHYHEGLQTLRTRLGVAWNPMTNR
ncbi:MAG: sigma-70 family RNA polymerase sigma factor [Isosphaeraceae bacterium]